MKKYIAASIIVVTTALVSAAVVNKRNDNIKICHSEVVWIKDNGTPNGISLKSKMSILTSNDNQGRINVYGYIKDKDATYRLDRAIYFNYQPVDKKGNYAVNFTSSSITTSDNTPDDLFSNFIQLEQDKIKYYVNITKMEDNIYILKDEAYSSFTCHVEK
ncbi:FidL-like protein [Providencia sp. Je.9.19]|uniref:FidL-like protein n=1 Tax=Providencia sp. Je.9.19 TaxID=3142844 RepID=UPI003DA84CA4